MIMQCLSNCILSNRTIQIVAANFGRCGYRRGWAVVGVHTDLLLATIIYTPLLGD